MRAAHEKIFILSKEKSETGEECLKTQKPEKTVKTGKLEIRKAREKTPNHLQMGMDRAHNTIQGK